MSNTTVTEYSTLPGFRFLCEMLSVMYKPDSDYKRILHIHALDDTSLESTELQAVQEHFVRLACKVKRASPDLLEDLNRFLNAHHSPADAAFFFDDAAIACSANVAGKDVQRARRTFDNIFPKLLKNKEKVQIASLAGIAMTFALAVGYAGDQNFYVGSDEVRHVLTRSMECLGYTNAEFIPRECFKLNKGKAGRDLLQLLLLAVFGALKVLYPHKTYQGSGNREKAREKIAELLDSDHDSELFSRLRGSSEMSRICQGMMDALAEDSRQFSFPGGISADLASFYQLPEFEVISRRSTTQILRCDYNFCIRSLVIAKPGSGKSLLTKAIVQTCLDSPESRSQMTFALADRLGMSGKSYIPLVLDCKQLDPHKKPEELDLIQAAVEQLYLLTRKSRHHDCLSHWDDFSKDVIDYYRRKAGDSALLLIIDDLSRLRREARETLLQILQRMEDSEAYSRLHILVISQNLLKSQMFRLQRYNQVALRPLGDSPEAEIRTLVKLKIGNADAETYLSLIKNNRLAHAFADSHDHLVKLLRHPCEDCFDMDSLLWDTIAKEIESHYCPDLNETACRNFLTALAVYVAECKKTSHLARQHSPVSYRNIPLNIVSGEFAASLKGLVPDPQAAWEHIQDNNILIYPNSGVSSCSFVNPTFYCSLVADHYLQLLASGHPPHWLDRFNRLLSGDFSYILVMLFTRLSRSSRDRDVLPAELSAYDLLLLVQSVIGHVASRTGFKEIFDCLQALQDILSDERISAMLQPNIKKPLAQTYANSYRYLQTIMDDTYQLSMLTPPEKFLP